jgi:hypothetical protein
LKDLIEMDVRRIAYEVLNWIKLANGEGEWWALGNGTFSI